MAQQVLKVSELTDLIKISLEDGFSHVVIEGEISNFKPHQSGHRYFSLKDDGAQISCVMWKGKNLDFTLKDGMKVIIGGSISVYPPRGSYQLDCTFIQLKGVGDLFVAFEELKKKLSERGYFEASRKKTIPDLPMKIGISTSPTGAAVQDMFTTIKRRFPAAEIIMRPTVVQGNEAAPDIVKAIEDLNRSEAEVIIIGRGGGSIEDLWAYNTEIVADAIYFSRKPIISAIGHETDFTIADFVSDLRAPTPTAAAELATPYTLATLLDFLTQSKSYSRNQMLSIIQDKRVYLDILKQRSSIRRVQDKLNLFKQKIDDLENRLHLSMKQYYEKKDTQIKQYSKLLSSLNPANPLEKGYAIIKYKSKVVSPDKSLKDYKIVEIIRKNETVEAEILVNQKLF